MGEGRGEAPSPRAPAARPEWPHRAQQEGPRQHGRGPAGAGGITPRGNLLAKQKRMFQAGLCSFLMAVPWPGARRPQTHSAVSSRPRGPYLFPDIKAGLFISELKQHTQGPGTGWAVSSGWGGRIPPPAITKHFAKELLQLVRPDEIFCPKLIIIMNLHFFPQENN